MRSDNSAGAPVGGTGSSGRDRKIRVLLVIKVLGHGGAERLLVDMVAKRDAAAFDYEVAYVLASEDGLAATIAADGTPVHALAARGNWDLRWVARLRALLVAGRYDVVHFHLPYTASLGRLGVATLPRSQRPAIVYTEHSAWDKMAVLVKALNRSTIGMDQSLIVVSEAAHQALPAGCVVAPGSSSTASTSRGRTISPPSARRSAPPSAPSSACPPTISSS